jgi:CBS domain-containing protein
MQIERRRGMHVHQILAGKGHAVATVQPDATVRDAVELLRVHSVGALVVSKDGRHVEGIMSERDVVRRLASFGASALDYPVSAVMTGAVTTCAPDDEIAHLMRLMTEHRIRHVPVVKDGEMVGIVSIGDVVKHRVEALQRENDSLYQYVTGQT